MSNDRLERSREEKSVENAESWRGHDRRRWPREAQGEVRARPSGPPALTPLRFSTEGLAPAGQFEAWRAHVERLVDIRLPDDRKPADGFPVVQTVWNLGDIILAYQRVAAHSYARSAAKLRASPIDHWQVDLLRHGRTWTEMDRRVAAGEPGTASFRSLGHPFRGRATDAEMATLYMAQDLFTDVSALPEAANNTILSGNLVHLLIDHVNRLEATLHGLAAEELPGVVHTLRDMVVACLSGNEQDTAKGGQADAGLMVRARRYIHRNLYSPDLTPEALAQELGVSRTRLYQLFEAAGGVLHYVRKRRLAAAHAALSNPQDTRRILEIAYAAGFDSPASFSRAFSQEFGYSPRQARKAPPARNAQRAREGASFEHWLITLGT